MSFETRLKKITSKYRNAGETHHVVTTWSENGKPYYKYMVDKNGLVNELEDEYAFWLARLDKCNDETQRLVIATRLDLIKKAI